MKKCLVLMGILWATAISTYAQRNVPFFQLGIKGGTNLSQLKTGDFLANGQYNGQTLRENLEQSWATRAGFVGGIYMRFGRRIFIQPEVLYSGKGGSYTVQVLDDQGNPVGSPQQVKVKTENIDVPVLLGLRLGPLRLNAGPVASFVINTNESIKEAITKYTNEDWHDTFNQATWGYQLGGGVDIGKFNIDVRYENSVSNLRFVHIDTPNGENPFRQKTKNWQVTLGMRLF
ncbi:MAG: PorT family protein [Siphonobacter aquaeclarae]|jgi:hypothetical protein|nr:PorT family protein [Siphonobacter aquaeclarae]